MKFVISVLLFINMLACSDKATQNNKNKEQKKQEIENNDLQVTRTKSDFIFENSEIVTTSYFLKSESSDSNTSRAIKKEIIEAKDSYGTEHYISLITMPNEKIKFAKINKKQFEAFIKANSKSITNGKNTINNINIKEVYSSLEAIDLRMLEKCRKNNLVQKYEKLAKRERGPILLSNKRLSQMLKNTGNYSFHIITNKNGELLGFDIEDYPSHIEEENYSEDYIMFSSRSAYAALYHSDLPTSATKLFGNYSNKCDTLYNDFLHYKAEYDAFFGHEYDENIELKISKMHYNFLSRISIQSDDTLDSELLHTYHFSLSRIKKLANQIKDEKNLKEKYK